MNGTYRPQPVRRLLIPKPDGSQRELGIPAVTDRVIQQSLLQVLEPLIDPDFSDHSYGFRLGRSEHQAVLKAQSYLHAGRTFVVDVDLGKLFDRTNYDVLTSRLERRIVDCRVLKLIRRYLQEGILANGLVMDRHERTPQDGPLSPLLANVLLNDVDQELERRGHCLVRYADDCNVNVRSRTSGERVMAGAAQALWSSQAEDQRGKECGRASDAAQISRLQFLLAQRSDQTARGTESAGVLQSPHPSVDASQRRQILEPVVEKLRVYLPSWKQHFRLAETPSTFRALDKWLRHRLRVPHLKHWKRGRTVFTALTALGVSVDDATKVAQNMRC